MGLLATIRHIKRLGILEERVDAMERTVNGLDAEWSDTNERLLRNLAKLGKRAQKLEQMEQADNGHARGLDAERMPDTSAGGLTPSQAQAQREILARRRGLGGG